MGYEARNVIPVWEIRERLKGDALMTERSNRLKHRPFYDAHCARVMFAYAYAIGITLQKD